MNRLLILKGILRACINLVSETFDFPKLVSRFVGRLVVRKKWTNVRLLTVTYSYRNFHLQFNSTGPVLNKTTLRRRNKVRNPPEPLRNPSICDEKGLLRGDLRRKPCYCKPVKKFGTPKTVLLLYRDTSQTKVRNPSLLRPKGILRACLRQNDRFRNPNDPSHPSPPDRFFTLR